MIYYTGADRLVEAREVTILSGLWNESVNHYSKQWATVVEDCEYKTSCRSALTGVKTCGLQETLCSH